MYMSCIYCILLVQVEEMWRDFMRIKLTLLSNTEFMNKFDWLFLSDFARSFGLHIKDAHKWNTNLCTGRGTYRNGASVCICMLWSGGILCKWKCYTGYPIFRNTTERQIGKLTKDFNSPKAVPSPCLWTVFTSNVGTDIGLSDSGPSVFKRNLTGSWRKCVENFSAGKIWSGSAVEKFSVISSSIVIPALW